MTPETAAIIRQLFMDRLQMTKVLDTVIFELEPKYIFINIGTNDLNGPDYELSGLIERYDAILGEIREANETVEALAKRRGAEFLNVSEGITDEQGRMKEEYTIEGMHMYGDGYMKALNKYKFFSKLQHFLTRSCIIYERNKKGSVRSFIKED